jgi:RNA polymerase sigma factor (sigma-70 family)
MTALEGKALLDHGKAIAKRYAGRVGPDVAEELGAEAVSRALRSPPPDGRFEPWLERIYRNLIVDVWRRRKPATLDISGVHGLATTGTPEDALLASERRRAVRASLAGLPREARRALLSRYYAELDDDVSASRLGIAGATVRTRIHRALERLRGRLGDLRALLPPVFGKVGVHVGAIGLAPLMVAALVVVSVSPRTPETEIAFPATAAPNHRATQAARPAAEPGPADVPVVAAEPHKRARAVARTGAVAEPALEVPAQVVSFIESDEVVAEIQVPEVIDIFSEPAKVVPPSLVEAPANFLAQFEKMVEDSL